ncbi:tricarboxylate transporter (plasmid) [Pacificitalea manganoxidans]|uniref:Tricarboxylate transporter n=1 Tax=Pacificitalea manganoxidans TaxID=1411902 RepID=A0A291M3S5_9RHOB|nr:tripartite tricarboxylate transporter permease [Pacificitalea manganoxidans]ATI43582.1 tricarboxylate transporter [Pacificitalea manganoxidans]MBF53767.1 tricarboxylate transporter [Actibacterium sp.]MDR6309981.1 putative tricarboxylic transport membrane protein [Pacificitalea manganoxidans]|tara:strand:- start:659 stop:2164 length:1506 start_codon:yes stop_codon:yes gene_type:complete
MFFDLAQGFAALLVPQTFLYLVGGFMLGLLFGAIPGLTATLAIALLLPFTFGMEVVNALVMVMGIYMSGIYAGSITGITVNIPGAPSGAITSLDGHALMKQGHGAQALGLDAFASSIGGMIGALVLMLLAQPISELALLFRTPDKFSLVLLAVITVTIVARGSLWKAGMAMALGLMISTVGIDPMLPQGRFDFDSYHLVEGIGLLPAVIGLFAVCELLVQAATPARLTQAEAAGMPKLKRRDFVPSRATLREIGPVTYVKSSVIGVLIGMLPGGGASMASFIAYAEAKRSSRHPEKFGQGSHEGLAASEAANNAMCGGAIIPLLTMGIPGDAVTAIIFGVLLIHGLVPGPALLTENVDVIAPMFAALFVASVFVFLSVLLFGPLYIRLSRINRGVLYAFIAMISMVGVFASSFSAFQMWMALAIGAFAFALRRFGYPIVPMLMGVILGPYLEEFLRRSLIVSKGDPMIFLTSPGSAAFLALTLVFVWLLRLRPSRHELPSG